MMETRGPNSPIDDNDTKQKSFDPKQIDRYGTPDIIETIEHTAKMKSALYKGTDEYTKSYRNNVNDYKRKHGENAPDINADDLNNQTYFRKAYLDHLNKVINDQKKKYDGENEDRINNPKQATSTLKELLGKEGKKLFKLAVEEEENSKAFRNALLSNSTIKQEDDKWEERPIVVVGGASGSGKSRAALKALKETQEHLKKDKNKPKTTNYVIQCDGGKARETSQIYKSAIRAANMLGYTGVSDLYDSTKSISSSKSYIMDFALNDECKHGVILPLTFSKSGFVPNIEKLAVVFDEETNMIIKLKDQSKISFCLVTGKDPESFKNIVAYLGEHRAWKTSWSDDESIITDLNDTTNLSESKEYDDIGFEAGIRGSEAALDKLRKALNDNMLAMRIVNDLIFVKRNPDVPNYKDENAWILAEKSDVDAIVVSEKNFVEWKAGKKAEDLPDFNKKAPYNPTIIPIDSFKLLEFYQELLTKISGNKNKEINDELQKLADDIYLALSTNKTLSSIDDLKAQVESIEKRKGSPELKQKSPVTASKADTTTAIPAENKEDQKSAPPAAPQSSPSTQAKSVAAKKSPTNAIREIQTSQATFLSFMESLARTLRTHLEDFSITEQEELATYLEKINHLVNNEHMRALANSKDENEILNNLDKMFADKTLIELFRVFTIDAATKNSINRLLNKIGMREPSLISSLIDAYNTTNSGFTPDKNLISDISYITIMPSQRFIRYGTLMETVVNNTPADHPHSKKIAQLLTITKNEADNANKMSTSDSAVKIDNAPSGHEKQLQDSFKSLKQPLDEYLNKLTTTIRNIKNIDLNDKKLADELIRINAIKHYIASATFTGNHESAEKAIIEIKNAINRMAMTLHYNGDMASEVKTSVKPAISELNSIIEKSELAINIASFTNEREKAIEKFSSIISDVKAEFAQKLELLPIENSLVLEGVAIEHISESSENVFTADLPIKNHDCARIIIRITDDKNANAKKIADKIKDRPAAAHITKPYSIKEFKDKNNQTRFIELSEYQQNGSINTTMESIHDDATRLRLTQRYFANMMLMTADLNKEGLYIQALKPSDLLIKNDGNLTLSDTKGLYIQNTLRDTLVPSSSISVILDYMPDALINPDKNGNVNLSAIQNYLIGITTYQLLTGELPKKINGKHQFDFKHKIFKTPIGASLAMKIVDLLKDINPLQAETSSKNRTIERRVSQIINLPDDIKTTLTQELRDNKKSKDILSSLPDTMPLEQVTVVAQAFTQPKTMAEVIQEQMEQLYQNLKKIVEEKNDDFIDINIWVIKNNIKLLNYHINESFGEEIQLPIIKLANETLNLLEMNITAEKISSIEDIDVAKTDSENTINDRFVLSPQLLVDMKNISEQDNIDNINNLDDFLAMNSEEVEIEVKVDAPSPSKEEKQTETDEVEAAIASSRGKKPAGKSEWGYDNSLDGLNALLTDKTNEMILADKNLINKLAIILLAILGNENKRESAIINEQNYNRLQALTKNITVEQNISEKGIDLTKGLFKIRFEALNPKNKITNLIAEEVGTTPESPTRRIALKNVKNTKRPPLLQKGSKITFKRSSPQTIEVGGTTVNMPRKNDTTLGAHKNRASEISTITLPQIARLIHVESLRRFSLSESFNQNADAETAKTKEKAVAMTSQILTGNNPAEAAALEKIIELPEDKFNALYTETPAAPNESEPTITFNPDALKEALGDNVNIDTIIAEALGEVIIDEKGLNDINRDSANIDTTSYEDRDISSDNEEHELDDRIDMVASMSFPSQDETENDYGEDHNLAQMQKELAELNELSRETEDKPSDEKTSPKDQDDTIPTLEDMEAAVEKPKVTPPPSPILNEPAKPAESGEGGFNQVAGSKGLGITGTARTTTTKMVTQLNQPSKNTHTNESKSLPHQSNGNVKGTSGSRIRKDTKSELKNSLLEKAKTANDEIIAARKAFKTAWTNFAAAYKNKEMDGQKIARLASNRDNALKTVDKKLSALIKAVRAYANDRREQPNNSRDTEEFKQSLRITPHNLNLTQLFYNEDGSAKTNLSDFDKNLDKLINDYTKTVHEAEINSIKTQKPASGVNPYLRKQDKKTDESKPTDVSQPSSNKWQAARPSVKPAAQQPGDAPPPSTPPPPPVFDAPPPSSPPPPPVFTDVPPPKEQPEPQPGGTDPMGNTPISHDDLQNVYKGLFKTAAEVRASALKLNTHLDTFISEINEKLKTIKSGPDGRPL